MKIITDKRTGMKYADYTVGGKRRRVSLHTKNNQVAIIKAAKLADDKDALKSGKVPFETFLQKYNEFQKATRKGTTIRHFNTALKQFLAYKKIKHLQDITPVMLDEFAIKLKAEGENAAGINRKLRALMTAMRKAEFWDMITPQNWKKVTKFPEPKGRVEFHSVNEIKQILSVCNNEWKLVVLIGCRAGLRRAEMANLKWEHIDFANNQIYVAPHKTVKYRYIPLDLELRKALENAFKRKENEFIITVGENRQSRNYISSAYRKKMMIDEELPFRCFLHKLRHTFASHLVQAGVDLYWVSKLMGHSSIKMTEIYAHLAPTNLKTSIKKLPKI